MRKKKGNAAGNTAKQIKTKIARGEDRTDWRKAHGVTGRKLAASIRADADEARGKIDWTKAVEGLPVPKEHINIRVDRDVLAWFKANGRGYQTLMNNVLRAFVQTRHP